MRTWFIILCAWCVIPLGTSAQPESRPTVKQERAVLKGHTGFVWSAAFSADGQSLATASWDTTIKLWDVATGMEKATDGSRYRVYAVAFSPDGAQLASAGGGVFAAEVKLWDLTTRRVLGVFNGHTSQAPCLAFAPDGKTIATGSLDKTIRVWEAAKQRQLASHASGTWLREMSAIASRGNRRKRHLAKAPQ
jgi:WD40 repeat protein